MSTGKNRRLPSLEPPLGQQSLNNISCWSGPHAPGAGELVGVQDQGILGSGKGRGRACATEGKEVKPEQSRDS